MHSYNCSYLHQYLYVTNSWYIRGLLSYVDWRRSGLCWHRLCRITNVLRCHDVYFWGKPIDLEFICWSWFTKGLLYDTNSFVHFYASSFWSGSWFIRLSCLWKLMQVSNIVQFTEWESRSSSGKSILYHHIDGKLCHCYLANFLCYWKFKLV